MSKKIDLLVCKSTKNLNFPSEKNPFLINAFRYNTNKQEIPCTTDARSTFSGLKSKILGFFHLQYEISVRQSTIMLYVRNLGLLPDDD
jgi:hypothetical protein